MGPSNNTWYLRGNWTNVVQVQCTPDGILRSKIQDKIYKVAGPDKGYTKVIESTGWAVTLGVKRTLLKQMSLDIEANVLPRTQTVVNLELYIK